ncbi:type I-E CRISPR-associated protein Cse2/CasB [Methanomassiliicoccaceae archaeon COG_1]|nr:type I-E CRISPR-associated protein Cse2/CasB [Methanomassiliicoccaceae archaeon COG_1]
MIKKTEICNFVGLKIHELQSRSPWSVAALARLRRGVGKNIEDVPDSWEIVLGNIPDNLLPRGSDPGRELKATYVALCLFAMHQQGEEKSVHDSGKSFAMAARAIIDSNNENAVKRRFDSVITSEDLSELSNHARGLIQIMKASGRFISFDYMRFAADLYDYQFDSGKSRVRIRWGMDFYKATEKNNLRSEEEKYD